MFVPTAKAYADDLRNSPVAARIAGLLSVASTAGLILAGVLLWIDTGRSATALLGALLVGGIALIGHTVAVVLQLDRRPGRADPFPAE